MLARLNLAARHLSRALPNPAVASPARRPSIASSAAANSMTGQTSLIHTAACLIIGDEVLGGKVCGSCRWIDCVVLG